MGSYRFAAAAVSLALFFTSSDAGAQTTKWVNHRGSTVCPTPDNTMDSKCPTIKAGEAVKVIRSLPDNIGRTVYEIQHAGGRGYINDYQYQYEFQDQNPKVVAERERARAAAEEEAKKKRAALEAEKNALEKRTDIQVSEEILGSCLVLATKTLPSVGGVTIKTADVMYTISRKDRSVDFYTARLVLDIAGKKAVVERSCAAHGGQVELMR